MDGNYIANRPMQLNRSPVPQIPLQTVSQLKPLSVTTLVPQVRNLAIDEFGFDPRTTLPAQAFCSDESQGLYGLVIPAYFGSYPFDFGSVGGRFANDRSPAAAHHGKNLVIFAASHVGYDPSVGDITQRFGRTYRPRTGLPATDTHAHSTACGKVLGVVEPFQKAYTRAKDSQIRLIGKQTDWGSTECIVFNNELLDDADANGVALRLDMERLIDHDERGNSKYVGGRANSTVFVANPQFVAEVYARQEKKLLDERQEMFKFEIPTPIGTLLTADYFDFTRSHVEEAHDDSHLIKQRLLPHMHRIVSSRIPQLTAAQYTEWIEFGGAVKQIRNRTAELGLSNTNILLVSGVNLDYYDHDLAEKNRLAGKQVYFTPLAAYVRTKENPQGSVFERDELCDLLSRQNPVAPRLSLDEIVRQTLPPLTIEGAERADF